MTNEEKMTRYICAMYGIEIIEEQGIPMLNGVELTTSDISNILSSSKVELNQPIDPCTFVAQTIKLSSRFKFFKNGSVSHYAA